MGKIQGRHTKNKIKIEHTIIKGILPILKKISKIGGVAKVIPAEITYSPKRTARQPSIKITREETSGFRAIAQSKGQIQVIHLIVAKEKRKEVESAISQLSIN